MKNYLALLFFLFALVACRNEPQSQNDQQEAAAAEQEAPTPQASGLQAAPAPTSEKAAEPEVGSRPAFVPPRSQDVLTVSAQSAQGRSGADVCVAVKVKGFTNLLALQYTLAWDPKVLEFKGVDKAGLPYLDQADFGFNRTGEGLLPFVWINDALQATTIPDEAAIYEVCFRAAGAPGQSSAIRFVEKPTPFEVVNIREELLELKPVEGKVTIE